MILIYEPLETSKCEKCEKIILVKNRKIFIHRLTKLIAGYANADKERDTK